MNFKFWELTLSGSVLSGSFLDFFIYYDLTHKSVLKKINPKFLDMTFWESFAHWIKLYFIGMSILFSRDLLVLHYQISGLSELSSKGKNCSKHDLINILKVAIISKTKRKWKKNILQKWYFENLFKIQTFLWHRLLKFTKYMILHDFLFLFLFFCKSFFLWSKVVRNSQYWKSLKAENRTKYFLTKWN